MAVARPGLTVYLAGPMSGLPFNECRKWRDKATEFLTGLYDERTGQPLYHILNPLRGHKNLGDKACVPCPESDHMYDKGSAERADVRRDRFDIDLAQVILSDLTDSTRIADRKAADLRADLAKLNIDNLSYEKVSAWLDDKVRPELYRASVGTTCELDHAHLKGKFIILVMTPDNPHWHSFIKDMAAIIVPTLDEALDYMANTLLVSSI